MTCDSAGIRTEMTEPGAWPWARKRGSVECLGRGNTWKDTMYMLHNELYNKVKVQNEAFQAKAQISASA